MKESSTPLRMPAASTPVPPVCSSRWPRLCQHRHPREGRQDLRPAQADGLMGMGVKQGDTVTIKVEGDDEAACAEAIQKFLSENV